MNSFVTSLHIRFNNLCLVYLVPFFTKFGWGLPVACLWNFATISFQGYPKKRPSGVKTILVLDKTGLTGDMEEVFPVGNSEIHLSILPRDIVKSVANVFLPSTLTDVSYLSDNSEIEEAKKKYRTFLSRVWAWYDKLASINAVVVANYSFYAERELAAAVEAYGTPFLALHKECVAPNIMWEGYEENCRNEKGPFAGRAMTVYNNTWRDIMIRASVVAKENIESVGCPRIDVYHRYRLNKPVSEKKKIVTFFSFLPIAGLPYIGDGEKEIKWPEGMLFQGKKWGWYDLARDSHLAIVELAEECPDVQFLIKIKVGKAYAAYIASFFQENLPSNVSIIRGGEAGEYILKSVVISGFNSTTLLEGIAAGKPVVVPRFAEAAAEETHCGILDLGEAVLWAGSKGQYKELLKQQLEVSSVHDCSLTPEAEKVLEHYIGNSDGHAAARMRAFILKRI